MIDKLLFNGGHLEYHCQTYSLIFGVSLVMSIDVELKKHILCPLLAFACAIVLAQEVSLPPEMAEMAGRYRGVLAEQELIYQKTVAQQPQLYMADIQSLAERLQKAGDLDGFLAADKELKRFLKAMAAGERDPFELTPEMPASAIVKEEGELRDRQNLYLQRFADADETRQKKISDLTTKYLARLKELQKELTIKNRIDDALAVKSEADEIQKALDGGTLVALAEKYAAEAQKGESPASPTVAPATQGNEPVEEDIPTFGHVPTWTYWKFLGTKKFAQEGMLVDDPDIPDELDADWDGKRNKGYVKGRCRYDRAVVAMFERSWLGKAFVWKVSDPEQLQATIELDSTELSSGRDSGPHARLALLDADRKVLKAVSVPLMSKSATLRVAYNKEESLCALNWKQGKETQMLALPAKGPFYILLGICVRQPGEECNTTFSIK